MKSINLAQRFHIAQLLLNAHNLKSGKVDTKNKQILATEYVVINENLFLSPPSDNRDYNTELMYGCVMNEAREFVDAFLLAPLVPGMEEKRFVKLLHWNKIIWAARVRSLDTLEFATWKDYHSDNNYAHGHYFDCDYQGSKRDFAIRAELINVNSDSN